MDGLLLDTERAARDSFAEITSEFGIRVSEAEDFFLTLVGTSREVTRQMVSGFIQGIDIDAFGHDWHVAMNRRLETHVPVKSTVFDTLVAMSRQGRRMAVVTSTFGARAREHLGRAGLLGYFETVVGGDEVAANKPDPAPYLQAAARMDVDVRRTVAFEDSDHGVSSAVRAGCLTVQIPDLRPTNHPLPSLGQRVAADLAGAVRGLGLLG